MRTVFIKALNNSIKEISTFAFQTSRKMNLPYIKWSNLSFFFWLFPWDCFQDWSFKSSCEIDNFVTILILCHFQIISHKSLQYSFYLPFSIPLPCACILPETSIFIFFPLIKINFRLILFGLRNCLFFILSHFIFKVSDGSPWHFKFRYQFSSLHIFLLQRINHHQILFS